jgi:murein DD-endopeptidase MepM/ murein hydrolase activator NlpD
MHNNSCNKIIWLAALMVLIVSAVALAQTATGQIEMSSAFSLSAARAANGSALWLEIDTDHLPGPVTAITARYQNQSVPLYVHPVNPGIKYFGLVALPLTSKAGHTHLRVDWADAAGQHTRKIPFEIFSGNYRIDTLTVAPGKVNLKKSDLERVKREKQELKYIWQSAIDYRLWQSGFELPIESEITSSFGNQRMFNNQLKSFHRGTDFRAAVGTPIRAANTGHVRLAKELFYSGNLVIIDHGTGIFSLYAHLSQIDVVAGQQIETGQQIGLSGATGRVNGPHLHWGIKVNNIYVDPLQFVDAIKSLLSQ